MSRLRPETTAREERGRRHDLVEPAELRAIASPPRQRLVSAFEALGDASVRELAAYLGRRPASLYFHLEKLMEAGLVVEVGSRPAAHRREQVYRLIARRLSLRGNLGDPEYGEALADLGRSIARASERDYVRAIEDGHAHLRGPQRNLALHHYHVHLRPRDRQRFVQLLDELADFCIANNDPERGAPLSFTASLAPISPKP